VIFPRLTCKFSLGKNIKIVNMAALRAKILRILTKYDTQINARLPPVGQRFWNHAAGICIE
jgi:hypothetical protein